MFATRKKTKQTDKAPSISQNRFNTSKQNHNNHQFKAHWEKKDVKCALGRGKNGTFFLEISTWQIKQLRIQSEIFEKNILKIVLFELWGIYKLQQIHTSQTPTFFQDILTNERSSKRKIHLKLIMNRDVKEFYKVKEKK